MAELSGSGFSPPPNVRDCVEFHWFHVGPGGALVLVALSAEPIWYVGHFDHGRMRRCRGDLCRQCVQGVGRQIRYVLCCAEMLSRQVGVLEVGNAPMMLIRDRAISRGGLRGMILDLSRPVRSKHGRLEVAVIDEPPPSWSVSTPSLDCRMVLERTWDREVGSEPKAVSRDRGEPALKGGS